MDSYTDAFKAMVLEEFFLEPRLADEFKAARVLSWAGARLVGPLAKSVGAKFGIPPPLVDIAVRAVAGEKFVTLPVRTVSDLLAAFQSPDDNYRSCCRSALCYAITGSHEWAFGALRAAASKHDDWARHHHLYGLIHGIDGNYDRALWELEKALAVEPHGDVRERISQAIDLTRTAFSSPPSQANPPTEGVFESLLSQLPEAIRLIVKMIAEVEADPRKS